MCVWQVSLGKYLKTFKDNYSLKLLRLLFFICPAFYCIFMLAFVRFCLISKSCRSDCLVKLSKPEQNVFLARALSSCVVKNILFFITLIFHLAGALSTSKYKDAKKVTDPWKDDGAGQFWIFSCKPRPLSVGNVCCLRNVEYSKHISLAEVEYWLIRNDT